VTTNGVWLGVDVGTVRVGVAKSDPSGILARSTIGVENIMWGNDYPHPDACWPHSRETIARNFAGVPDEETRKIVRDNALELYGINEPAEVR
jgi:predicted TIM-barrel fold metal-dependent hydrolase